jgi:alpha-L-rhamnosidase
MAKPVFVWCDASGTGRNVFVLFRRSFTLSGSPGRQVPEATLHLFADTRYRLWINGEVAAYGPARFVPSHPEYDTVDLRPWLRKGPNALVVEVNSFGEKNYQAAPSIGGFIAWGRVRSGRADVDLSTPGQWKMQRARAWDEDAPTYSFAQTAAEIFDARALPTGVREAAFDDSAWACPVVLDRQDAWGKLRRRSIPMLSMDPQTPESVLVHGPLAQTEEIVAGRVPGPRPPAQGESVRCCYGVHIHSPVEQDVILGLFWGPHYVNGVEVLPGRSDPGDLARRRPVWCTTLGNRQDYPARLRAGWNFLYGEPELLRGQTALMVGLPRHANLIASADCREECPETMVFSEGVPAGVLREARGAGIPIAVEQMPQLPVPYHRVRRGQLVPAPARLIGWDRPVRGPTERTHTVRDLTLPTGQDWVVLFDFGREFGGHAMLDVDAPAGTVLDVAYEERRREDGLVAIYATNWHVDNADRFIAAGGRQRIEGFRSRGGRYLQISVRNASGPVVLHGVQVRNTLYPAPVEGRFECSDPILNWVWATGVETIRITTEDAWNADAWRERGMYINDSVVIHNAAATFWSDPAMVRRCLRLWAQSQNEDGLIPCVVPAWWGAGNVNTTSFWVHHIHDYVERTGDRAFLREMWPQVARALAGSAWRPGPRGLLSPDDPKVWFCDWGMPVGSERGQHAMVNAHAYGALQNAATLATFLGDDRAAGRYAGRARRLGRAFDAFWDPHARRYAITLIDGEPFPEPTPHASALALRYGLARGAKAKAALAWLEQCLSDERLLADGHMELYFHYWALEALYRHGRVALAEEVMRKLWGTLKAAGAWSLWETASYGAHKTMQLCQGWAAGPLVYMARRILGVRPVFGKPRQVLVAPTAGTLDFARGAVAHPAGPIEVDWQLHGTGANRWMHLGVRAPRGLRIHAAPDGPLTHIPVRTEISRYG